MTTTSRVAEPDNAPGDLAALELTLKNATKKPAQEAPADSGAATTTDTKPQKPDWIADKFWTGNLEESTRKQAEAYSPLQSAYGRMANDLGTQRKITDQILALDKRATDLDGRPAAQKREPPKVDPRQLVDNPTATLDAYWKQREEDLRKEWEAEQQKQAATAAEQAFMSKHGDFATVTQTPKFVSWVHSSPLRMRAAALAGQGNYVVADELLTEYKALEGQGPAASDDPNRADTKDTNVEAARKAALESAAGAGGGSSSKGPLYRRADLIALKMTKPHVYSDPTFQAEILRAYAEGRVK